MNHQLYLFVRFFGSHLLALVARRRVICGERISDADTSLPDLGMRWDTSYHLHQQRANITSVKGVMHWIVGVAV